MGNAQSSPPSSPRSPSTNRRPTALEVEIRGTDAQRSSSRPRSADPRNNGNAPWSRFESSTSNLQVPGAQSSTQSHRRSQSSGSAQSRHAAAGSDAPPPPYSAVVAPAAPSAQDVPPPVPPRDAARAVSAAHVRRHRSAAPAPPTAQAAPRAHARASVPSPASAHARASVSPPASGRTQNANAEASSTSNNPFRGGSGVSRSNSLENALVTLRKFDTVIIVDDSNSMVGARWAEAREALASLAALAAQYDTDGIDVCFLNSKAIGTNMRTGSSVQRLFDSVWPNGATPIGEKLEEQLLEYLDRLDRAKDLAESGDSSALTKIKPRNYIVLTDGVPTDDPETVIVAAARRLDTRHFPITQIGIQFVQIGDDPAATEFLKELDDDLVTNHGIRDIVDTTPSSSLNGPLNAAALTKILLGGVNRRVDRRGGQSVL